MKSDAVGNHPAWVPFSRCAPVCFPARTALRTGPRDVSARHRERRPPATGLPRDGVGSLLGPGLVDWTLGWGHTFTPECLHGARLTLGVLERHSRPAGLPESRPERQEGHADPQLLCAPSCPPATSLNDGGGDSGTPTASCPASATGTPQKYGPCAQAPVGALRSRRAAPCRGGRCTHGSWGHVAALRREQAPPPPRDLRMGSEPHRWPAACVSPQSKVSGKVCTPLSFLCL